MCLRLTLCYIILTLNLLFFGIFIHFFKGGEVLYLCLKTYSKQILLRLNSNQCMNKQEVHTHCCSVGHLLLLWSFSAVNTTMDKRALKCLELIASWSYYTTAIFCFSLSKSYSLTRLKCYFKNKIIFKLILIFLINVKVFFQGFIWGLFYFRHKIIIWSSKFSI